MLNNKTLTDRLNEISKIKDSFNEKINYQQSLTIKLSKYLTILDILNKILTVFLTVFSSTNIFGHIKKKKKKLLGLIVSKFSLIISSLFGIIIKLKQEIKIKKKKHNKLLYSAKNKIDCIETLISNLIKDRIISHNEFLEILKEEKDYDFLKSKFKTSGF